MAVIKYEVLVGDLYAGGGKYHTKGSTIRYEETSSTAKMLVKRGLIAPQSSGGSESVKDEVNNGADLQEFTVAELKEIADDIGAEYASNDRKDEIIEAITNLEGDSDMTATIAEQDQDSLIDGDMSPVNLRRQYRISKVG